MTDTEYIRALASALTRQEDVLDAEARDILYEFALRIYALLLRDFPTSRFERYRVWPQFRAQILIWLQELNDVLAPLVLSRVIATEAQLQAIHAELFTTPPLAPRATTTVLDTTRVLGTPLSELFTPSATGVTPFALQLLRLIERSVYGLIFQEAPTAEIARRMIEIRTRAGREEPVPRKGTVANAWRERLRAVTAALLWGLVSPTAQRYALEAQDAELRWRWNAVLDPRTCPICRPLHNTMAPDPDAFPRGAPPLHPLCRCAVIPIAN
ncbi:MAG: Phage Mu protein like protein [Cyanobacteriota bacterium]